MDDIFIEAYMYIMNFRRLADQSTVNYEEAFWTKVLLYRPRYDEYSLKVTSIDGLIQSF